MCDLPHASSGMIKSWLFTFSFLIIWGSTLEKMQFVFHIIGSKNKIECLLYKAWP